MQKTSGGTSRIILIVALLVAVIVVAMVFRAYKRKSAAPTQPPPIATTQTAKPPTLAAMHPSEVPRDTAFLDVVRAAYPGFPATQPLEAPLELSQAAHLHLSDPIYLGGLGRTEMWITRGNAPAIESVLKDAVDEKQDLDVHVLRQRPVFVHWMPAEHGQWPPYLVCPSEAGAYEVISAAYGRQPLPAVNHYHWDNAMSWNDKVVVPTAHGISIFTFGRKLTENHHELIAPGAIAPAGSTYSEARFLLDSEGLLAWLPWESGKMGGLWASHYVEPAADETTGDRPAATWTDLTPATGWPAKLLHLVPLLDGTVLMLTVDEQGAVQVQFNTLEHAAIKNEEIEKLVDALGDADQTVRSAAHDKLSQYGSGIWPILEKLLPDAEPEAQVRLRQLLKQKVVPTLNGMSLVGKKDLKLAARLSDGGTVFYAEAGVSIPNPEDPLETPAYRVPAWISIRPGRAIELLPEAFTSDLTAAQSHIYVSGNDWIVSNDGRGPRRFVGNGFVTLLRKSEHDFSEFVGRDRRGRWLFRQPATPPSATAPTSGPALAADQTLIIDPTLPDPIPRLPVWIVDTADEVGWDKQGWPVTKKTSAYALHESGWQLLGENDEFLSKPEQVPSQVEPNLTGKGPTTLPATTSATMPEERTAATLPATTSASEEPLLADRAGTRYFGGLSDLRIVPMKGPAITWPLPAIANGEGPAWLVRAKDGRLFLFNQPGRVIRLMPTPGDSEPYKMEKIFTHQIPTPRHPTRVWMDPAGRIAMVWNNQLAIMFPDGYIPPPIAELMLNNATDDADE